MSTKRFKPRKSDRRKGPRRRSWLVEDWRNAHRFASVRIAALILASEGLIVFVPTLKEWLPANIFHGIMGTLAVCVILARITKKPEKSGAK